LQAVVAAPGLEPEAAAALSAARLRVFPHALKLAGLLDQADLCIAHGGPGLCARALIAGVPMALLPGHLEQYLVARRVVDAGCASLVATDAAAGDFSGWIRNLLADEGLHRSARAHAKTYGAHDYRGAASEAARRIMSFLEH
jgi:UDP:flavonoid glycosyltransferase YjiC (YdhE family)